MAQYVTSAEVKAALGIADNADDAAITLAVDAASSMLEEHCGRRFDKDATTSARRYSVPAGTVTLRLDDIDPTGPAPVLTVPAGSTAPGPVAFGPDNAAADGRPWTFLHLVDASGVPTEARITGTKVLTVEARYGWPAVPAEVRQAALVQALRLVNRRHSPYGIAGSPEAGSELRLLDRLDPDVALLVRPFVKGWYVA